MTIEWAPEAIFDLADLRDYIARDNPEAAVRLTLIIVAAIEVELADNPELGHPGRVSGTRELVIPDTPVIVPYRVQRGALQILGVYHHARRWPEHF
jgi:toxin ParE1/3/4